MPEAVPLQPAKYTFFVYIVESPSAHDLYHGRSEGGLVANALSLDGMPCVTRTAINTEAFVAALRIGMTETMKQFPRRYPVLHISAHGGKEGIQLSSGEVVTWPRLRDLLVPMNESLQGVLLLCMSSCEGYNACQMAMESGVASHPYIAMIGNYGTPQWSDTAVSYLSFYHLMAKGWTIYDAVEAMKFASGDQGWVVRSADEIKQGYLDFLATSGDPGNAQRELETVAENENLPANAKALEGVG